MRSDWHLDRKLIIAAKNGKLEDVKHLLQGNTDINASMYRGYTALLMASKYGHKDIVDLLLQYNANVTSR